jgi:hypothetical protein
VSFTVAFERFLNNNPQSAFHHPSSHPFAKCGVEVEEENCMYKHEQQKGLILECGKPPINQHFHNEDARIFLTKENDEAPAVRNLELVLPIRYQLSSFHKIFK